MTKHRFEPRPGVALAIDPAALTAMYEAPKKAPFETVNGVAVVRIEGPLAHRAGGWCDSYDEIRARCAAAFAARPVSVMLLLDTPGGEVAGCFELVRELRAMSATSRVPLYSYADGMAASAGYALATAGERIFAPATAIVGSIGVISGLVDMTKAIESSGVRFEIVASGARKADGHPANPIHPDAVAALQVMVNTLAGMFFALVSEGRPSLTIGQLRALEAGVMLGADAVREGLIDEVATLETALAFAARRAPAAPVPASAGVTRDRVATPDSKRNMHMSTKKNVRAEAPVDDKEDTKTGPSAVVEECDLAKLREALAMPDSPAQEVVDAAAEYIVGDASEPGEPMHDEEASALRSALAASKAEAAGLAASNAVMREANSALVAQVETLKPFAAAHAERERELTIDAAMAKHGIGASHRARFLDLAKTSGADAALASIAASVAPPVGTVGGQPPASSTSSSVKSIDGSIAPRPTDASEQIRAINARADELASKPEHKGTARHVLVSAATKQLRAERADLFPA